jgi:phosphoribosylanthranilate isomerase
MKVKICGITTLGDAQLACEAGADFIGFILAPSVRRVELRAVVELLAGRAVHGRRAEPVLVFRDAPPGVLEAALAMTGVRWVQLHGREDAACLAELRRRRPGVSLIKAWEVTPAADAGELESFLRACTVQGALPEVVLLDQVKNGHSTAAQADFERCAAAARAAGCAVWLAGGLRPETVAERLRGGAYEGVDVAAGVESAPGHKDAAAVRAFLAAARSVSTGGHA